MVDYSRFDKISDDSDDEETVVPASPIMKPTKVVRMRAHASMQ
jgi:hypothetical protein